MLNKINLHPCNKDNLKPKFQINFKSSWQNNYYEIIGLTKRLSIQTIRRPSSLILSSIQPIIWLVLFGALFQEMMLTVQIPYNQFLNTGIIIFTSFTSAMNAGLPIIFDREFGFFNRLIISPLISKYSILISSIIITTLIALLQTCTIINFNMMILKYQYYMYQIIYILFIIVFLTIIVSNISICLAFIIPGHVEFLALVLISNLPILFSSTALAPISFMPKWLQLITCLNPITYAIEILRFILMNYTNNIKIKLLVNNNINIYQSIFIIILITMTNVLLSKYIIKYKCE